VRVNIITAVVIVGFAIWLAAHANKVAWTPVRMTGAAVAAVALVLLLVARIQLGRSFSVTAKANRLVTSGLYARIRNPIYLFSALFLSGLALAVGHPRLLLWLLLLVPVQAIRARREESVLRQAFGEEYTRYKAQTWF